MKAAIFEQFGEPAEVLSVREVPPPEPGPGEVRVQMLASPVNPSDLMMVRGVYGDLPQLPATPGFEGVGLVESSGGGAFGKWLVGKRVAVLNRGRGNWSEQTVIPAKQAIPLPSDLPVEQAAMFFVNPATAYVMTCKVLRVPRGAWLLQTAAGSALGRMVIRLGRRYGFRTLNVVRREAQAEELRSEGAEAALVFDADRDDPARFAEEVRRHAGSSGVRYALDPVGGKTGSAAVLSLGDGGRLLVYGSLSPEPLSFSPRHLLMQRAVVEGFWLGPWMQEQSLLGKLSLVRTMTKLMREKVLVSEVRETFPLDRIVEAVTTAELPARGGKVLLRMQDESR